MVSEPGPESDPIFLGTPVEDEVFGLPSGNYPKETSGANVIKLFFFITDEETK